MTPTPIAIKTPQTIFAIIERSYFSILILPVPEFVTESKRQGCAHYRTHDRRSDIDRAGVFSEVMIPCPPEAGGNYGYRSAADPDACIEAIRRPILSTPW